MALPIFTPLRVKTTSALPLTNAVVSVTHTDGTLGPQNEPAFFVAPKTEHFTELGGQVEPELWFVPTADVRQNDKVTLISLQGHPDVGTFRDLRLQFPTRMPGPGTSAYIRCLLHGYYT